MPTATSPARNILDAIKVEDGPSVFMVHGIGGIGKTTLLGKIATAASDLGFAVVDVDCASIEPTEAGFLHHLATRLQLEDASLGAVVDRLDTAPSRVLLTLDGFEAFRLLDTWLRRSFLSQLSPRVRVILAGRNAPLLQWSADPTLGDRFRAVRLEKLDEVSARALLERAGVPAERQPAILELAQGHPLALRLAAAACADDARTPLRGMNLSQVLRELTRYYVDEIDDDELRIAVEAASTVRRVNVSMLGALLSRGDATSLFDRLAKLHFIEPHADGIALHSAVRDFVASDLRARDPQRFVGYRRAAWKQMRRELRAAPTAQLWRYTADLVYLLENPVVREAFFPSGEVEFAVEPAVDADHDAVLEIVHAHDGEQSAHWIDHWWVEAPSSFSVVRDGSGDVVGFYCCLDSAHVPRLEFQADPLTREWDRDRRRSGGGRALFLRRWLARSTGEAPSAVQAACWLDLKRTYIELRPELRHVYLAVVDPAPYLPVATRLGFVPLTSDPVVLDGRGLVSVTIDFGPASVDGWLGRLFDAELGQAEVAGGLLDPVQRQLCLEGVRVDLSPLEFGVLRLLLDRDGEPVTRRELLSEVWDVHHEGSSNVVDGVVKTLRKKLGRRADELETVRGVGYRYCEGS